MKSEEDQMDLQKENQALHEQLALRDAQLAQRDELIAQLLQRVQSLEERLSKDSHNSHMPPSSDRFQRQPKSLRQKSGKKPGGQTGHQGKTLEFSASPDEVIVHAVACCPQCQQDLHEVPACQVERRQVVELPPSRLLVREHRAEHKPCPRCQQMIVAPFPPEVRAPIQYGASIGAIAVYLVEQQLLPLARAAEVMEDLLGVSMSEATICELVARCSQQLEGVEQLVKTALHASAVIHQDETGLHVAGKRGWAHVTSTAHLTHSQVHSSRGTPALEAIGILPGFAGTSVHDGWGSSFRSPCAHAICNVHILRDLTFLCEEQGLWWAAKLKALLLDMKDATNQAREQGKSWLHPLEVGDWQARVLAVLDEGDQAHPRASHSASSSSTPITAIEREKKGPEKPSRSFDVCIVCALPEEARALLLVLRDRFEGDIEERISPRHHYDYRFTSIKNNKAELLNLHISWLPRYGPQEMTLHFSRVLEEFQPRIALMTGICAGDSRQVQLGDLVVAERTFTYDSGKFTRDEYGRNVHLLNTLTYQLDANILQYLGLFDAWKPLVAGLDRPPSSQKPREIACHLKAMASGNAVRADNPFEDVQVPVRDTVAIDMEGASFGLVMSRYPHIPWLIVKGVCDYADRTKNDVYHDYAARASALYALSFIRTYVTLERLSGRSNRKEETLPQIGSPGENVARQRQKKHTRRAIIVGAGGLVLAISLYAAHLAPDILKPTPSPIPTKPPIPTAEPTGEPGKLLLNLQGHSLGVYCVIWIDDGKYVASCSSDRTVRVWDVANDGKQIYVFTGHTDFVNAISWSIHTNRIASASYDTKVLVWGTTTGDHLFIYSEHRDKVYTVAWSPDGKRIASGGADKSVQVWDAGDGNNRLIYTGHQGSVTWAAWSPDGTRIASCSTDKTVQIWNAIDKGSVRLYTGHTGAVYGVAWSPDGTRIASCSTDKTVQVWDARDGGHKFSYKGHLSTVMTVVWSPDGKYLASGGKDNTVHIWNASDGKKYFIYADHTDIVNRIAWSPDGKRIASASDDHTVHIWSTGL